MRKSLIASLDEVYEEFKKTDAGPGFYSRIRLGKREVVKKPAIWKVTYADGTIKKVSATNSMEAVKESKKLHNMAVQRVKKYELKWL